MGAAMAALGCGLAAAFSSRIDLAAEAVASAPILFVALNPSWVRPHAWSKPFV